MAKIEITDEAVERALNCSWAKHRNLSFTMMKQFIDAALNPPPEPEIVVTEEQIEAGNKEWCSVLGINEDEASHSARKILVNAYRAMRKLELKDPCAEINEQAFPHKGPDIRLENRTGPGVEALDRWAVVQATGPHTDPAETIFTGPKAEVRARDFKLRLERDAIVAQY